MNATSKHIAERLVNSGSFGTLGGTADWSIYARKEPMRLPENVITIYDTPGFEGFRTMDPAEGQIEQPSFLVRVRAIDYDTGWTKAKLVHTTLHRVGDVDSGETNPATMMRWDSDDAGARYLEILAVTDDPISLGEDENKRWIFVMNFTVKREAIP